MVWKYDQKTIKLRVKQRLGVLELSDRVDACRKIGWRLPNGMPPDEINQCPTWRNLAHMLGIEGARKKKEIEP